MHITIILCILLWFANYIYTHVPFQSYYIRHKAETHENRRFFSTGMEFSENAYAYVLKAPSRS